jgi:hypothetical protein
LWISSKPKSMTADVTKTTGDAAFNPTPNDRLRLFTGRSGHLAVMAEFLHRGINVAIPEVDIGDDVFVVRGDDEAVTRVQVKSGNGKPAENGSYSTQFNVPWKQLTVPDTPALVYVFAVRFQNRWSDFIVIRRSILSQLQSEFGIGSVIKQNGDPASIMLRITFSSSDVRAGKDVSLLRFRNAFDHWPPPQE